MFGVVFVSTPSFPPVGNPPFFPGLFFPAGATESRGRFGNDEHLQDESLLSSFFPRRPGGVLNKVDSFFFGVVCFWESFSFDLFFFNFLFLLNGLGFTPYPLPLALSSRARSQGPAADFLTCHLFNKFLFKFPAGTCFALEVCGFDGRGRSCFFLRQPLSTWARSLSGCREFRPFGTCLSSC